ncbi:hypothetical protein [Nostoc sp. LEGE 12450]|nr:hypothetical protein [Nostoc sp. LEGE 12450]
MLWGNIKDDRALKKLEGRSHFGERLKAIAFSGKFTGDWYTESNF